MYACFICKYVCACVCIYPCVYTYACLYAYMYIYSHVCTYWACVNMYTLHIHMSEYQQRLGHYLSWLSTAPLDIGFYKALQEKSLQQAARQKRPAKLHRRNQTLQLTRLLCHYEWVNLALASLSASSFRTAVTNDFRAARALTHTSLSQSWEVRYVMKIEFESQINNNRSSFQQSY